MDKAKLVEIYCVVDEFCKGADRYMALKTLVEDGKRRRHRKPMMSDSEVMTILTMFHLSRMRDLKSFYLGYIKRHCQQDFPKQLSYNRFVERQTSVGVYLLLFLNLRCLGPCTGISFIDSTPLRACHIKRAHQHRSLKGWAQTGDYCAIRRLKFLVSFSMFFACLSGFGRLEYYTPIPIPEGNIPQGWGFYGYLTP